MTTKILFFLQHHRKPTGSENLNLRLYGNEAIGIFDKIDQLQTKEDTLKTWSKLEKHELRLRMSMAPRNYFEKMAYWTEEGKIWHFPIDNEQGKANVHNKLMYENNNYFF